MSGKIAELSAPLSPSSLFELLYECGFTEERYLEVNRHLASLAATPNALVTHFCEQGIREHRYFKARTDIDIVQALTKLQQAPLHDKAFAAALLGAVGRALTNERWFRDPKFTEAFDRLTDDQIRHLVSLERFGAMPYFVFGDSHSRLYQHLRTFPDGSWSLPLKITFSAASARGLGNPKSRQQNARRIANIYSRIQSIIETRRIPAFFKFGQVDVEYVHPFNRSERGEIRFDPEEFRAFCELSIDRYISAVSDIIPAHLRTLVTICSISPPVLRDEDWPEGYVRSNFGDRISAERVAFELERARKLEVPDIYERTRLHAQFSARLEVRARDAGFGFIDDAKPFLRADGRKVDEIYTRISGGRDVHLDRDVPTLRLMERLLHPLIAREPGGSAQ